MWGICTEWGFVPLAVHHHMDISICYLVVSPLIPTVQGYRSSSFMAKEGSFVKARLCDPCASICKNAHHFIPANVIKYPSFFSLVPAIYSSGTGTVVLLCIEQPKHWQSSPQGQKAVSPEQESPPNG